MTDYAAIIPLLIVALAGASAMLAEAFRQPGERMPIARLGLRVLLGEFADVLVTGQRVVPRKALESGFEFRYPELEGALRQVLGGSSVPGLPSVSAHASRSEVP